MATGVILWDQSRLQQAVTGVTGSLTLDEYLLECRRYEENLILRQNVQYANKFAGNLDSLQSFTCALQSKTSLRFIRLAMDDHFIAEQSYQREFLQLVSLFDNSFPETKFINQTDIVITQA